MPYQSHTAMFVFKKENFDCILGLEEVRPVFPGQTVTIPMQFLDPDSIKGRLRPGDKFQLRELNIIAEGEVLEVHV